MSTLLEMAAKRVVELEQKNEDMKLAMQAAVKSSRSETIHGISTDVVRTAVLEELFNEYLD